MKRHDDDGELVGPQTRGLAARTPLTLLDQFREGAGSAVLSRIPPASLALIESTESLGWISAEHERHVTGSIFEVLGPRDGIAFFRWLVSRHMLQTPLLRPMVTQVNRMFGVDPGTVARLAPGPFRLLFRNFGELVPLDRRGGWAEVELRNAPPMVFDHPQYGESWRGALAAVFDLALTDGEVDLTVDAAHDTLRFVLRW